MHAVKGEAWRSPDHVWPWREKGRAGAGIGRSRESDGDTMANASTLTVVTGVSEKKPVADHS